MPHDNKAGVKFATDEQFDQVYGKTPNQLRALGIEVPKEASKNDQEEKKEGEGDQIMETQNIDDILDAAMQERVYKMK